MPQENTNHPRILVLRGGAIGDFVLTLPALRALRTRWPSAWIELLGYPHIAGLALADGVVDRIGSLDRAQMATFFSFQARFTPEQAAFVRSFDVVINYLHDPDGLVRGNLGRAGARLVVSGSPLVTEGHAADFLARPLEELAIYPETAVPNLTLPEEARARGRAWLTGEGLRGRVWALHPGSGSPAKTWSATGFVAVARHLLRRPGVSCFFVAGEADDAVLPVLQRELPQVPVCRARSLVEVAEILSCAQGFVGNDSGISHLAAALRLPVVCLFGPTDPARWAPRGEWVRVVRSPDGRMESLPESDVISALPLD